MKMMFVPFILAMILAYFHSAEGGIFPGGKISPDNRMMAFNQKEFGSQEKDNPNKCLEDNGRGLLPDPDCIDCDNPPKQGCEDGLTMNSFTFHDCTIIECKWNAKLTRFFIGAYFEQCIQAKVLLNMTNFTNRTTSTTSYTITITSHTRKNLILLKYILWIWIIQSKLWIYRITILLLLKLQFKYFICLITDT